ncbi:MAG TPA: carboxypeptidase-like regulatory domain-containing protein, partial [Candidatus Angelobacter sp.]|nr:carboxypeptidase-like regulatory domain-containing protein [Candidatus Angelobacter sp.]
MPYKLGLTFAIFFAAVCTCQEVKPDAAQTGPAQTATSQTAAGISGTVLQADMRTPLKNVQVTATRGAKPEKSDELEDGSAADRKFSTETDEKGHFEFADLVPGTYYVNAAHVGMVMKGARAREGMVLTLEAGKPQNVNLVMLPGAVITGHVLNEDGEPMQHVSVGAMRYIYSIYGRHLSPTGNTAETDDKGEYRLFGLQPGSYLIAADPRRGGFGEDTGVSMSAPSGAGPAKANSSVYVATYYPNETSPTQATPILVKPGDEAQANLSLSRVPAHNISGTITGFAAAKSSDKEEHGYRFVTAIREGSPFPMGMAFIPKDSSSFKISSVPSGKYKIMATQTGAGRGTYGYKEVTVDSSDVTGVVISLTSATNSHITGTVHTDGEAKLDYSKLFVLLAPQAGANEQADEDTTSESYALPATGGYAEVKKDGSFKMDLAPSPNSYQVVITAPRSGLEDWFTSKVLIGGKDVLDSGFKSPEVQRGTMEIIISNKGAT